MKQSSKKFLLPASVISGSGATCLGFFLHLLSLYFFPAVTESLNHDATTSVARILQNQDLSILIPLKAMITEKTACLLGTSHQEHDRCIFLLHKMFFPVKKMHQGSYR